MNPLSLLSSKWVIVALVIACAGLTAWGYSERAGKAAVEVTLAQLKQAVAETRAGVLARYRAIEAQRDKARKETEDVRAASPREVARMAAAFRAARAERDGLRKQLADYAIGRGPAEDTLAACHQRASRLGEFVDDGLLVQETLAERAESCAADLRSLRTFLDSLKPGLAQPGAE